MSLRTSLAVCSALALACVPRSGAASSMIQPSAALVPVVVALGDSLTAGPGLARERSYPALLEQKARAAGWPHRFVNRGVSGDTSSGGLRRLEAALEPGTTVLIVALGVNDGLRGFPVESVRTNIGAIIERAQARGIRVLLCGIDAPPVRGWNYTLEFHTIFPRLAERYHVPLAPFMLEGVFGVPELNLPDGLHPNAAGHRVMADYLWPYVEPMLKNRL